MLISLSIEERDGCVLMTIVYSDGRDPCVLAFKHWKSLYTTIWNYRGREWNWQSITISCWKKRPTNRHWSCCPSWVASHVSPLLKVVRSLQSLVTENYHVFEHSGVQDLQENKCKPFCFNIFLKLLKLSLPWWRYARRFSYKLGNIFKWSIPSDWLKFVNSRQASAFVPLQHLKCFFPSHHKSQVGH